MAPFERRPQRLLARQAGAAAAPQQRERVAEPRGDLRGRQHVRAGGGELEREWHAVEPAADLGDRVGVVVGQRERVRGLRRPLAEQAHGLRLLEVGGTDLRAPRRQRQRRHAPGRLAGDPQPLAAGGQHAHVRARAQQCVDERRAAVDQVLAVVEHQQQARVADLGRERPDGIALGAQLHADRGGGLADHERRVPDRAQLHQAGAAIEAGLAPRGQLERQPRLSAAPWAGEREQMRVAEPALELGQLAPAADEAREPAGEAARRACVRVVLAGQDLAVQLAGLGVRVGPELAPQQIAQLLVLGQRLLAAAVRGEQAHKLALRRLVQRVLDHHALQGLHGRHALARVGQQRRELDHEGELRLAQGLPPRLHPVLVAVLRQQLAAVQRQRRPVVGDRP